MASVGVSARGIMAKVTPMLTLSMSGCWVHVGSAGDCHGFRWCRSNCLGFIWGCNGPSQASGVLLTPTYTSGNRGAYVGKVANSSEH